MAIETINDALAEMVTAFRAEVDAPQARLYRRLLSGVPDDVISEAADRLMVEPGRRFMPTPAEWMTVCSQVVAARRMAAAKLARQLRDDCPVCLGSGFQDVEGPNQVLPCPCVKQAAALMDGMPAPIKLALPSGDEAA